MSLVLDFYFYSYRLLFILYSMYQSIYYRNIFFILKRCVVFYRQVVIFSNIMRNSICYSNLLRVLIMVIRNIFIYLFINDMLSFYYVKVFCQVMIIKNQDFIFVFIVLERQVDI